MTYVAEPYLYVTDQVLTALTGGVARETHRFYAGTNAFAFEVGAEKVVSDSVRAIGQANGTFFAFQPGRDFAIGGDGLLRFLVSGDDPSQPAKGATWPDEATEFHVGYYTTDSDRALLTDRNVGSLTRTMAEAFARELAVLRTQLELVYRSGFVDTAEGTALDLVVALLGLTRKGRDFASGTVRFFRDTPAPADIFVPAGTKVSTALPPPKPAGSTAGTSGGATATKSRPVSFVTASDRTLRRGQLSVEAPVRAEEKGPAGVVEAKAIAVIDATILGISGVVNDAPTVYGATGETDDELRRRAKTVAERAGRATPRALVNSLTELSAIRENDVKVVEELQLRPGVVQVFVAADPTAELAVAVDDALLATRAAGIRVEHNLQSFLPQAPSAAVSAGDVRDDGAAEGTASGADFKFPLCADVVVFPESPRLTGADKDTMKQAVTDAVVSYVEASTVGGSLVYNRMSADLMDIPGIVDVVLNVAQKPDSADTPCLGKRNILVPKGQRGVIDPADVKVTFAGAPVNFDLQVAVTLKAGATLADARSEVKAKLADSFAGPIAQVDTDSLMARLGVSQLFTVQAADISWTAEYDQAGLIIREPGGVGTTTTVAQGDVAVLRDVQVEEKT
jgi:uncharacterized phage protein gp47/JayE